MSKIVLQAVPFCYGPAVVALRLRQGLIAAGYDVQLLAKGSVRELAMLSGVPSVEYSSEAEVANWASRADAYCCVCDPEMFKYVKNAAPVDIYVDFLYFMAGEGEPPPEASADLYLIE